MKWYIHQDRDCEDPELHSYTLTQNKHEPGWRTDSGYPGSGLPKELAQWICNTLNESQKKAPYKQDKYGCWEKNNEVDE